MHSVLLADPNPDNLTIYGTVLTLHGFRVLQAKDGEQCLRTAATECPDIIVIELELPLIDGYEVARRLKSDPATARLPVIALAQRDEGRDRDAARAAGFDGFVPLPCGPRELLVYVQAVLAGGRPPYLESPYRVF